MPSLKEIGLTKSLKTVQEEAGVVFNNHFETLEYLNAVSDDVVFPKQPYVNPEMTPINKTCFESPDSVIEMGVPAGYMGTFSCLKDDYDKQSLLQKYTETTSQRNLR